MKCLSLFVYDSSVIENFIQLLNPMLLEPIRIEVYLYTAYATNSNIGSVGVLESTIRNIKTLTKYTNIAYIDVYGMITTGEDSVPDKLYINNMIAWIKNHIDELDLDGIFCDFVLAQTSEMSVKGYLSDEWNYQKKQYTEFLLELENALVYENKRLCVNIDSYISPSVKIDMCMGSTILFSNLGIYKSEKGNFFTEFRKMYNSRVRHNLQIPVLSFAQTEQPVKKYLEQLSIYGYKKLAIFNPTMKHDYLHDVAEFINKRSVSKWNQPTQTGCINATLLYALLGLVSGILAMFNITVMIIPINMLYITGGLFIISTGGSVTICCKSLYRRCCLQQQAMTMNTYTLLIFNMTIAFFSLLWFGCVELLYFCDVTDEIRCNYRFLDFLPMIK